MVSDYKMNLIEVRKLENTDVFKTDVKQVFDYIRCSGDWDKLKKLVMCDPYYSNMEEDAFDMAVEYVGENEMLKLKDRYKNGEKVNMSAAIMQMKDESRQEGISQGINQGIIQGIYYMGIDSGMTEDEIVEKLSKRLNISYEEATAMYDRLSRQ